MRNIAWDQNFGRAKRPRVQEIPVANAWQDTAESAQGKHNPFRMYAPPASDTAPSVAVWRASTPSQTARTQEKRKTNAAIALADIQRGPPAKGSAPATASSTPTTALPVSDVITLVRPYEQSATSHRPGDYHDSASEVVMHVSPRRLQGAPESTRGTGPAGEAQAPPTTPYAASSTSHTAPSQTADGSQSFSPNSPNPVSSSAAPPAKRQRRDDAARSSLSQTSPVRCFSCQRTDVPLIVAGREFSRPSPTRLGVLIPMARILPPVRRVWPRGKRHPARTEVHLLHTSHLYHPVACGLTFNGLW